MRSALALALLLLGAAPARAEVRVAVMELGNGSPSRELDPLAKGLQSMITTDLAQVPSIQLVERERLQDIQAELALARSAMIDKTTAAKIGKLAGATHLCGGSFTVVGAKMRIDLRLFSTQTGEVLLAEQIEGDKDAFFDLEKALVKKVVDSLGVKLAAKERVALERVHTTDFGAFAKYSEGLQAFDEKRYDDALAALREAAALDGEFKLALTTLEETQRVVAKLHTKVSKVELEALRADEAEIAKLWAKAKAGDQWAPVEIFQIYSDQPNDRGDRFARDRNRDLAAQEVFAIGMPKWREWYAKKIETPTVDAFRYAPVIGPDLIRRYERPSRGMPGDRHSFLYFDFYAGTDLGLVDMVTSGNDYFAGVQQHLDERQIVALQEELTNMAITVVEKNAKLVFSERDYGRGKPNLELVAIQAKMRRKLAGKLRSVLELKRSTQVLEDAAKHTDDAEELRRITEEVEYNRDLEGLLAGARDKDEMRQLLQGRWLADLDKRAAVLKDARGYKDAKVIDRRFVLNDYLLIGKVPVWLTRGELLSGKRADDRRADEIRYYAGTGSWGAWTKKAPAEAVAVVEGRPRANVHIELVVERAPGADWPADEPVEGRAEVGFAFGLRDVVSASAPTRGFTLFFGGPTVQLVELGGARELPLKVIDQKPRDFSTTNRMTVAIDLGADSVTATINGERFSFRVPPEHLGYYGLHLRGRGFASITSLAVVAR